MPSAQQQLTAESFAATRPVAAATIGPAVGGGSSSGGGATMHATTEGSPDLSRAAAAPVAATAPVAMQAGHAISPAAAESFPATRPVAAAATIGPAVGGGSSSGGGATMNATTEESPDLSHAAAAPVAATAPVAASAEIEPAVGGGEDRTGSDSGTGKYILLSESGGQESIKVSAATVEAADTVPAVGGSMGGSGDSGLLIEAEADLEMHESLGNTVTSHAFSDLATEKSGGGSSSFSIQSAVGDLENMPQGPVEKWSVDDMASYLHCISLGHLRSAIKENGLDGKFPLQLTQNDVSAIGIGPLQWKKIMAYLPK